MRRRRSSRRRHGGPCVTGPARIQCSATPSSSSRNQEIRRRSSTCGCSDFATRWRDATGRTRRRCLHSRETRPPVGVQPSTSTSTTTTRCSRWGPDGLTTPGAHSIGRSARAPARAWARRICSSHVPPRRKRCSAGSIPPKRSSGPRCPRSSAIARHARHVSSDWRRSRSPATPMIQAWASRPSSHHSRARVVPKRRSTSPSERRHVSCSTGWRAAKRCATRARISRRRVRQPSRTCTRVR